MLRRPILPLLRSRQAGEVALKARKVANGRDFIELAVADTGIGVTVEQ